MTGLELNPTNIPGEDNSLPLDRSIIAQASKVLVQSGQEVTTVGVNSLPGFIHDQTGVSSDFIPGKKAVPRMSDAKHREFDSPPVVLDDRPCDFIQQTATPARDVVNMAQERIAASIMLEHEARNKQYEKAVTYVESMNKKDRLSAKQEATLPKAIALVESGVPMSLDKAKEIALERMRGGTTQL